METPNTSRNNDVATPDAADESVEERLRQLLGDRDPAIRYAEVQQDWDYSTDEALAAQSEDEPTAYSGW